MAEPREQKNVVHEMSIWKQLIENELRTAKEWDANWGFLKETQRSQGESGGRFEISGGRGMRDIPSKMEEVSLPDYENWYSSLAIRLSRGDEEMRRKIWEFMERQGRVPNYREVVKSNFPSFELKIGEEVMRWTVEIAVRRPKIDLFEITYSCRSSSGDKAARSGPPSRLVTPRLTTPRAEGNGGGGSRLATPRSSRAGTPRMAAAGMAVLQKPVDGDSKHEMPAPGNTAGEVAFVGANLGGASLNPIAELAETCGDKRLAVLARAGKTPKERFGKPVLASHVHGWGKSLEKFGVNHYGIKRNEELWPEV